MKVFHMEADMSESDEENRAPLKISIWANRCKIEQGLRHRALFLMEDDSVVAEIQGKHLW